MKFKLKHEFYKTDKKTRIIYYIYSAVSVVILIMSYILNYTGYDVKTSLILAELSVTMLAIGVWGGVFCELMKEKFKKIGK